MGMAGGMENAPASTVCPCGAFMPQTLRRCFRWLYRGRIGFNFKPGDFLNRSVALSFGLTSLPATAFRWGESRLVLTAPELGVYGFNTAFCTFPRLSLGDAPPCAPDPWFASPAHPDPASPRSYQPMLGLATGGEPGSW